MQGYFRSKLRCQVAGAVPTWQDLCLASGFSFLSMGTKAVESTGRCDLKNPRDVKG